MFKSLNRGISASIAIIIIVVLAVIVGGGILVYQYKFAPEEPEFTPTPPPKDETADWKTYTNKKYNFEMKYPPNLVLRGPEPQELGDGIGMSETLNSRSLWSIDINKHAGGWTAEMYTETLSSSMPCERKIISDITVGGIKGKKISFSQCTTDYTPSSIQTDEIRLAIIEKDGYFYIFDSIDKIGANKEPKEYYSFFDQMLSTFRFLD